MKSRKQHIILLLAFFLISTWSFGQEKTISVDAGNKSLNLVLEEISKKYDVQFAFDADFFSKINANLQLKQVSVEQFLNEICQKYHLVSEKIDKTWVLYEDPTPIPLPKPEYTNIEGIVTDRNTGEPLLFCNISLGENHGTITNELGIFNEKIEKKDQVTISISHLGYHRLDTTISLTPGHFYRIALKPFSFHIETINVYQQEKHMIEMADKSERIAFNPKQSANLPRLDDSDLISALSLIPGVNFLGGQTSGISIRGGSPSENLILLDGIPILETSHLFGNMSVLNAKFISQAFVSRGGFDASYGERVSGIVELTGQNNYYKPSLDLSANMLSVNAAGEIPIGKLVSISGAYRKSYIDQWENYLYKQILSQESSASEDASSVVPTVSFDDMNVKMSIKPTEKQELSFNIFESNDLQKRNFVFSETSRFFREEQADSKNRGISGNLRIQSGNNWQNHLNLGYNELGREGWTSAGLLPNKQGKGGKDELNTNDNSLEEFIVSWSTSLKTGNITHQLGLGGNQDKVSYQYFSSSLTGNNRVDSINYHSESTILHGFLQEKIKIGNRVNLRVGVRANHENQTNKIFIQPRAGISFKVTDDLELFYSGGLYNQFLSRIRKIDSNGNMDLVWYLPDSTGMGTLKSIQHVAGARFAKNGLSIDIETYYKKITGKVNLYAESSGGKEKVITYMPREGESESYGLDALVHYKQGIFTHMLAWSVSKTTEQFEGFNNGLPYPAFDDQRNRLRWTEMARYKSWVFSTNLTYRTGSPYLISQDGTSTGEFGRLPFFAQADFSLIKRFKYNYFQLSAGISLLNLLNRENVLEVDYFNVSDATGSYSVRTDITAMKFTPVFFINIRLQ